MKTKTVSIILFAFSVTFFCLFNYALFYKATPFNSHTTTNIISLFFCIYCPIILIIYRLRISALRKNVSMEMLKEKRNKLIFVIFVISWIVMSIVGIIGDFESFSKVEWFKELRTGLVSAIIIFIAVCVSEYFYLKRQFKNL